MEDFYDTWNVIDARPMTDSRLLTVMRRPATCMQTANGNIAPGRPAAAASLSATMAQADLCTMQRATAYSVHA